MSDIARADCPVCGTSVVLRISRVLSKHNRLGTKSECPASGNSIDQPMCSVCGRTNAAGCKVGGCYWITHDLDKCLSPYRYIEYQGVVLDAGAKVIFRTFPVSSRATVIEAAREHMNRSSEGIVVAVRERQVGLWGEMMVA